VKSRRSRSAVRSSPSALRSPPRPAAGPYVMGSVVEMAGHHLPCNTGLMICGVIMLVGGIIGTALMRPERETTRCASEMLDAAVPEGAR